jgi:ABC-type uncharacterized transport system substrate-binding protein
MRRRDLLGSVVAAAVLWPPTIRAQQSRMPVIGLLHSLSADRSTAVLTAFREGLREAGYIDGKNVAIEYRWAEGHYDRLPSLAADLVGRKVDVIATGGGTASALAAKKATTTIPIVLCLVSDAVGGGLVASLARPGGNITGVSMLSFQLMAKRIELLSDLLPQAKVFARLVNPTLKTSERQIKDAQEAARIKRLQLRVGKAATESEIDAAFAALVQSRADALVVGADAFLYKQRNQFAALASRYAVPAIYELREYVAAGGLISYGNSLVGAYRQAAALVAKILAGANPADLPVEQPTKFELVINLKTAKALGLTIPQALFARADEVIE